MRDTQLMARGGHGDDQLFGDGGNDDIEGFHGLDTLQGGDGDDVLAGWSDNDELRGGAGNDILVGGIGADTLYGNAGNDLFKYNHPNDSRRAVANQDRIADFQANAQDRIDVFTIDANPAGGGPNDAFVFMGNAPITAVGQLGYWTDGVNTYVELYMTETVNPDMVITLAGVVALDATDFIL